LSLILAFSSSTSALASFLCLRSFTTLDCFSVVVSASGLVSDLVSTLVSTFSSTFSSTFTSSAGCSAA
jgi:hypothetical protein